jgi:gluconokinase
VGFLNLIVMGVSGCGKTTLGRALAVRLGLPFIDGDDHHPAENRIKMERGEPLTDRDRTPWLDILCRLLAGHATETGGTGCVLACSALKQRYRDTLTGERATLFIYLKGDRETLRSRLVKREGHFMPADLLDSQLETLEEPADAVVLPVDLPLDDKVLAVVSHPAVRS